MTAAFRLSRAPEPAVHDFLPLPPPEADPPPGAVVLDLSAKRITDPDGITLDFDDGGIGFALADGLAIGLNRRLFIIGLPVVHRDRKAHGNRPSRALRLVAHSPASLDDED
jgi:hypothetical protein